MGGPDFADAIVRLLQPAGIRSVEVRGSRLLVDLDDASRIYNADLDGLQSRGWVRVAGGIQVIVGPGVEAAAEALTEAAV